MVILRDDMKKISFNDRVLVQKDLKDNKWRIGTELTDEELIAIGTVTIQWAYLEHAVFINMLALSEKEIPKEAFSADFSRRLDKWKELIKTNITKKREKERLLNLVRRIAAIARTRHRISHGIWDWLPDNPKKINASSFKPTREFKEGFDLQKLIKFGEDLGEINFALTYPGGFGDVISSGIGGTSRAVELGIAKIVKADPL